MGFSNNVPVFLDEGSGWSDKQCEEINKIVLSCRKSFESKAKQKTKEKPSTDKLSITKYNRVLNLSDFYYLDYFSMSFILNPAGMEAGKDYPLIELKQRVKSLSFEGSHSDRLPRDFLSNLGYIYQGVYDNKVTLLFHCNSDDFPEDENHERVQFSVYCGGRI